MQKERKSQENLFTFALREDEKSHGQTIKMPPGLAADKRISGEMQGGELLSDAIFVAVVTGLFNLAGIMYSSGKTARAMNAKLDTQQAVMKTEMNELTREVREHNNFARRMPVVEEQIKVINHRIKDLEDNEGR